MTETENHDVQEEAVAPTVEDQASEQLDAQGQEVQSQSTEDVPQGQEDSKELNFKALRDQLRVIESQKEQLARENEEYRKVLMDSIKPKAPEPAPEVDELADLGEEDWTTRKHVETVAQRQARQIVEEALRKDREERYKAQLPDMLKKQFNDFDDVVTKENVDYLKANKPHIAATLAATKDPYAQAAAAYEYIKAYVPSVGSAEDKEKAIKNAQKPGTLGNAQGASPLSQAKQFESGKLTPEMKRKLQQEMIAAARSR